MPWSAGCCRAGLAEWLACGVIWGAFVCTLLAFLALSAARSRIELCSWLAAFDFKAPITLYLDPLSLVADP